VSGSEMRSVSGNLGFKVGSANYLSEYRPDLVVSDARA
jgi:hypothetical protein